MGWFWGDSESKDNKKNQDPLRNLDPSLREFLAKESPVKYGTSDPATRQAAPQDPTSSPKAQNAEPAKPKAENDGKPEVPPQSQFPDGRYAHLWKTYVPQNQVEESMKTDAEKINDVLEGYKQRKGQMGRAALENCALEQEDLNACFESGGMAARMTMCSAENKKLDRCYVMQGKFLRALGYLSTYDRSPEVDEQIQMHADALYHRMLDQEKEIEAAKAEGRPIPSFPPLLNAAKRALPAVAEPDKLPLKTQIQLKERLKDLSPEEKEIEQAAIRAEIESGVQVATGLGKIYKRQDEERQQRKEAGKETISDKFFSVVRWH